MVKHTLRKPDPAAASAPVAQEWWPIGILTIGASLQFVMAVWFIFLSIAPASVPHMLWNAIATPFISLVAIAWVALRLAGLTTAHSAGGFSLCGLALAARAQCELLVWLGGPPTGTMIGEELPPPLLVDLVRHGGTVTYVAGLVLVVSSSVVSIRHAGLASLRRRPATVAVFSVLLAFVAISGVRLVKVAIPLLQP